MEATSFHSDPLSCDFQGLSLTAKPRKSRSPPPRGRGWNRLSVVAGDLRLRLELPGQWALDGAAASLPLRERKQIPGFGEAKSLEFAREGVLGSAHAKPGSARA